MSLDIKIHYHSLFIHNGCLKYCFKDLSWRMSLKLKWRRRLNGSFHYLDHFVSCNPSIYSSQVKRCTTLITLFPCSLFTDTMECLWVFPVLSPFTRRGRRRRRRWMEIKSKSCTSTRDSQNRTPKRLDVEQCFSSSWALRRQIIHPCDSPLLLALKISSLSLSQTCKPSLLL